MRIKIRKASSRASPSLCDIQVAVRVEAELTRRRHDHEIKGQNSGKYLHDALQISFLPSATDWLIDTDRGSLEVDVAASLKTSRLSNESFFSEGQNHVAPWHRSSYSWLAPLRSRIPWRGETSSNNSLFYFVRNG